MGDNCGDYRSSNNDNDNGNGNVRRRRNNNNNGSDDDQGNWTNERHSDFLSLMEASFVRSMFHKNCIHKIDNNNRRTNSNSNSNSNSRLDRFVPDIAESTLDLPTRNFTSSGIIRVLDPVITQRQRSSSRSHNKSSHDQVVPKLKDRAGAKGEN